MQGIISEIQKGNDVSQADIQKVARKLVSFFKKEGFAYVSQDTRKYPNRYLTICIQGKVSQRAFDRASTICKPTKTHIQEPDFVNRKSYYSYFIV